MRRIARFCAALAMLLSAAGLLPRSVAPAAAAEPARPVLAYYYGWWGSRTWDASKLSDRPPEWYESTSDDVMRRQIREAKGAGIDGFICTWRYTCARLLQLAETEGGFAVTFSVDPVGDGTLNSYDAIAANMAEMSRLASSSAYLRWDGKPVFVFWNDTILPGGDGSLGGWQRLRGMVDPGRTQFWLGGGVNFDLLDVFDAIHFFDITWERTQGAAMTSYSNKLAAYNRAKGASKPFVATVMPGYDDRKLRGGHYRDREGGAYYRAGWDTARSYNPRAVIVTSWNEWLEGSQIEPSASYGNQYLDITRDKIREFRAPTPAPTPPPTTGGFADANFASTWQRTDKPVQDQRVGRSWVWGPQVTAGMNEPYNGGSRLVQYFDKSRMEVNNPSGDRAQPWFVTNGLLVVEMVRGQIQTGDSSFENRGPADEALGGDPRVNNPDAPGYGSLANLLAPNGDRTGQQVASQLRRDGSISAIQPPAAASYASFVPQTGHNIPGVFWNFMNQSGTIYENGRFVNGKVVDWVFAFGYPVTDAYWMRARLGGNETWMLVQAFERRILTYTPTNPAAFQVEMGNVGQHYYRWRYNR
ncbi:MAG TPA: glycoside hydrolase family 99-like domain-containing protein [Herpetosiphonaceae bacterium]